jgi:hypothetical protein
MRRESLERLERLVHDVIYLVSLHHRRSGIRDSMAKVQQVPQGQYSAVQQNAARTKGFSCKVPKPIVLAPGVNGHAVTALLDSGSPGDFHV